MRRIMIAGCIVLSLVEAANVQAAEGESYVTVAQADGNVSQTSVDRANDLLNVMENLLGRFLDNEDNLRGKRNEKRRVCFKN